MLLNILVIHGYAQTAAMVAGNTVLLKDRLSDIATLNYVEGPPMRGATRSGSRPWWILDSMSTLEFDATMAGRWNDTVQWWSNELSTNQYDGVIGLSQGSAMTGLLISMINHPDRVPGFQFNNTQPLKFGILCSGFVSHKEPHGSIYGESDLPTLHTVDDNDSVVPASRTIELQKRFKNSQLLHHGEGHAIPVRGDWPRTMRRFIAQSAGLNVSDDTATQTTAAQATSTNSSGRLHPSLLLLFLCAFTFLLISWYYARGVSPVSRTTYSM